MKNSLNSQRPPYRLRRVMAGLLGVVGIFLLYHPECVDAYRQATTTPSGLYIPNQNYQFTRDEIKNGGIKLVHVFRVYNARPHWRLLEANPDCGCTSVSWQKAYVPPLSWVSITAVVPSKSIRSGVGIVLSSDGPDSYIYASLK